MEILNRNNQSTPASLGYFMPAEWEKHEATWLSWPHNTETWPAQLAKVEETYVHMVEALSQGEKVNILVDGGQAEESVRQKLSQSQADMDRIVFLKIPTADAWMRDYGPIFLAPKNRGAKPQVFTRWHFNAWGNKYEALKRDGSVPVILKQFLGAEVFETGMVLEGGSVDVNGEGDVLTTEQCLLNPNRNPGLTRGQIEQKLRDYLGAGHVIWLGRGIAGDDTDGHIDDIARFVAPDTVVCSVEENPADENYTVLQDNLKRLKNARDKKGRPLKVIELPMPGRVAREGARLPASYANFYIGNHAVLASVYHHAHDAQALKILGECFPGRRIVGIPCEDLVYGLGAVHCVTQQQPAI